MPVYKQTVMCAECPFRANSVKGWLGPATAQEVKDLVHGEGFYFCHVDIDKKRAAGIPEDMQNDLTQHCVGFLRYRASVCKRGWDREQADAQDRLEGIPDAPIIAPFKFLEHHEPAKKKRKAHDHA